MNLRHASLCSLAGLALLACGCSSGGAGGGSGAGGSAGGGGTVTDFAVQFCAKYDNCSMPHPTCEQNFSSVVFDDACQQALLGLSCSDLANPALPPTAAMLCEPPCSSPGTAVCNSDGTASECTKQSRLVTVRCDTACKNSGRTWSGVCGPLFMGLASPDGQPKCWCQ